MHIWIFQSGEPLHVDHVNFRAMRAINLANALVDKGHKVTIWSSDFFHQKKKHRYKTFKKKIINKNLDIRLIPSPGYKKNISIMRLFDHFILAKNLKRKLNLEKKLPDVAFVGFPPIETSYMMISWLNKKNIPNLLDIKDMWPSIFLRNTNKFIKPFAKFLLKPYFHITRKTIQECTGVCSISKSFIDWAIEFSKKKTVNSI